MTIQILDDDGDVVRELADDLRMTSGKRSVYFSGDDDDGDELREGDYEVRVVARNSYGSDKEELDLEIGDGGNSGLIDIYDLDISDDEFDPDRETIDISFRLNRTADVSIKVYDEDGDRVRELWDDRDTRGGRYEVEWDGEDDDSDDVSRGDYTIVVSADSSLGDDEEEIDVEVE